MRTLRSLAASWAKAPLWVLALLTFASTVSWYWRYPTLFPWRVDGVIATGAVGGIWAKSLTRISSRIVRLAVAVSAACVVAIGAYYLPLASRTLRITLLVVSLLAGAYGYQAFLRVVSSWTDQTALGRFLARVLDRFQLR